MKIIIMNVDLESIYLKATIISLLNNLYDDIIINKGILRNDNPSRRVMDGWKEYFKNNILDEDLLLLEDDLFVKVSKHDMVQKIDNTKINYIGYQKTFKENCKVIPVGGQAIFIPKNLIPYYKEELLKSRSIHFDRWNSRLEKIYYPYKPKEFGEEYERISSTTGKLRKGKILELK